MVSSNGSKRLAMCVLVLTALISGLWAIPQVRAGGAVVPDQADYKPIQPGAAVTVRPGPAYPPLVADTPFGICTMNFVFRGHERRLGGAHQAKGRGSAHRANGEHTYIGTAGHCLQGLAIGERVAAPDIDEFGALAFRIGCRPTPCEPVFDDFALIRIDADKLDQVSPVMRGLRESPSGVTTSDETSAGDIVVLHGQGAPFSLAEPGRTQAGVLEYHDAQTFATTLQGPAHSGSPVVRLSDRKALGIVTNGRGASMLESPLVTGPDAPLSAGPTVEYILQLLGKAGFDVHLVTADALTDRPVRSGTVLGSNPFWTHAPNCGVTPDCAAWLASGCDARLTGADPAVSTSIVNVSPLRGSGRRIVFESAARGWLGTIYEFWSSDCRRVGSEHVVHSGTSFTIPREADWMTIPAVVGPYPWELW